MSGDARARMTSGDWYCCLDETFERMRETARVACHQHNTMAPGERGACAPALRNLLGHCAPDAWVEAPFHASYAVNLSLGSRVYLNAGCVILDSAAVTIGAGSMLGPGVHIYCADHHPRSG